MRLTCEFPQIISFRVRNIGPTPGRLTVILSGDTDEPYIGPDEVLTLS